ncbi:hypothetical protein RvY_18089 [Ramazzottius varieornatus]|uniref:BTB domain-containing protein n=1 Tax=Ramazzottius varieornatus TaxID=947166 RepID=A0A1D1W4M6_RAMVA|nr:hypothetical protein RvY_18089 [Ramazzottius varieornatus]
MADRAVNCAPCSSPSSYSPVASSRGEPSIPSASRGGVQSGTNLPPRAHLQLTPINVRLGQLHISVDMPASISSQEIESAGATIQRQPEEIMWSIAHVVQDFHKRRQFNDAVVKVANGEVSAHRHVLCAASPWMHKFIHGQGRHEAGYKPTTEIRLEKELDVAAISMLVDYMYTARCRLNYYNVYSLLMAATFLQMPTVIAACERLLAVLTSDEHIAVMLEIAEQAVGNKAVIGYIYEMWIDKFYNQIQLISFVEWPYSRTEYDVLTAALRWINHERHGRMVYFVPLMKLVRWVYMSQEELVQAVELEKMLIRHKEVKQLITDAQWYADQKLGRTLSHLNA